MRKLGLTLAIVGLTVAAGNASAGAVRPGPVLTPFLQLYVVSRSGHAVRRITHDRRDHFGAVWSPDASLIADAITAQRRDKVEVLTPGGRLLRRFDAGGERAGTEPAFSPDSRTIAYADNYYNQRREATDAHLVTRSVAGGPRRVLANLVTERPAWSPDGRTIAYLRDDVVGSFPQKLPLQPAIWTVGAEGSSSIANARTTRPGPAGRTAPTSNVFSTARRSATRCGLRGASGWSC